MLNCPIRLIASVSKISFGVLEIEMHLWLLHDFAKNDLGDQLTVALVRHCRLKILWCFIVMGYNSIIIKK